MRPNWVLFKKDCQTCANHCYLHTSFKSRRTQSKRPTLLQLYGHFHTALSKIRMCQSEDSALDITAKWITNRCDFLVRGHVCFWKNVMPASGMYISGQVEDRISKRDIKGCWGGLNIIVRFSMEEAILHSNIGGAVQEVMRVTYLIVFILHNRPAQI